MLERVCNACGVNKPITAFHKNLRNKYGVGHKCKPCALSYAATYRKEKYAKVYALKYKTTEAHMEQLLLNVVCQICGNPESRKDRRLVIDHEHSTNKIRGVLCDNCNIGLGKFKDNMATLNKAIAYLERFKNG
jgi:hypothetical protein